MQYIFLAAINYALFGSPAVANIVDLIFYCVVCISAFLLLPDITKTVRQTGMAIPCNI